MPLKIYEPLNMVTFGGSHFNVYLIIDLTKLSIFFFLLDSYNQIIRNTLFVKYKIKVAGLNEKSRF